MVYNQWKPVEISGNIFAAEGSVEGLIGIEECLDYDVNSFVTPKKKRKRSKSGSMLDKVNKKICTSDKRVKSSCDTFSPSVTGSTLDITDSELKCSNIGDSPEEDVSIDILEAWNEFGLPKSILKAISESNFKQPTQIQMLTLPAAILGRRDILGAAETGSGKTLAFGLPILTGILRIKQTEGEQGNSGIISDSEESDTEAVDENGGVGFVKSYQIMEPNVRKPLYALILTPTRELAMQVRNHLKAVAKYTGINVAVVVGGMAAVKQERILSKGPEIVVATPGRLWELIQQGNDHLSQVDNVRFLAIDETDRMLERGHFQELHDLLERINTDEEVKKKRQNFVFSATLTLVHALPKHLVNKSKVKKSKKVSEMSPAQKLQKIVDSLGITDPKVVDLSQGTGTSSTLTECRITCEIDEKDYYVYYFLKKHPGRTIIFCNSIGCVKRLATLLSLLDCNPLPLHASMQQRQRLKNLEKFRDTENSILVATDVAARGLDIPSIEHVLHYQTPRTSEGYVHRSGRTARASKQGITVLIMEPKEFQNYLRLCRTLGKGEDLPSFPVQENCLNAVKQRVNLARELDKLQLQVRKANSESGWLQKAAEDMDILVDDFVKRYDTKEARTSKKIGDIKRKQLTSLLAKPIFPKGFPGKFPLLAQSGVENNSSNDEEHTVKAVDVMKNALEISSKKKKRLIPLYRPNKNKNQDQIKMGGSGIKLNRFNKNDKPISNRQKKKIKYKSRK